MIGVEFGDLAILLSRKPYISPFREKEKRLRLKMNWKKIIPTQFSIQKLQKVQ
jgi:hypothetical protein